MLNKKLKGTQETSANWRKHNHISATCSSWILFPSVM